MSSRAEGCGLWLSTKGKRSTQLPLQKSGKAKKSKQKFFLRSSARRSNGLDIRVSSSPLSPRSRKKLQNAKQTKINKYFGSETYSKDSRRGKILEGVSELAGCFEGKLPAKISVKRKQKENTFDAADAGYLTEAPSNGEKERDCSKDVNISGISQLDETFEDFCERLDTNSAKQGGLFEDSDFVITSSGLPRKKCRTLKSGDNLPLCSLKEKTQSLPLEREMSQSFHFSQWKKDQIAECKEIQDKSFDEYTGSPFTAASCSWDFSQWKKDQIAKSKEIQDKICDENTGSPSSAASSWDFSQWKQDQIAKCKEIQGESCYDYTNSPFTASSSWDFSQWKKDQIAKCREIQNEQAVECSLCTNASCDDFSHGKRDAKSTYKETLDVNFTEDSPCIESETPAFQFTQWANQQVQICREIQEQEGDPLFKRLHQLYVQKKRVSSMVGCFDQVSEEESGHQGQFSDWTLNRERTSKDDACDEIQEYGRSNYSYDWENEGWDKWSASKRETDSATGSSYSDGSEFQFSDLVKNVKQFKKETTRHFEYNETFWQANE